MLDHLGIHTPYFGILLSLIPFVIATYLYKNKWFLLIGTIICQYGCRNSVLKVTGISYQDYKIGGNIINFF